MLQVCPESKANEDRKDPEELTEKTANEDLQAQTVFLEKMELMERTVSTERTVNLDNKDPLASVARMVLKDLLDQLEKTELKVPKGSKEIEARRVTKANLARMACTLAHFGTRGET